MKTLNNFTLLYIEDDKETVLNLKEILEDEVKELYIAYNGKEGLDLYREFKPDIILTDINMPIINGIDMSKIIKNEDSEQNIVIFTAFNETDLLNECINIGIDGYITKPLYDLDKLFKVLNKIAKNLEAKRNQEELRNIKDIKDRTTELCEMIGNIAHQWRQPLSVISTIASNINLSIELNSKISNDKLIEYCKEIVKQTQDLSKTIDEFRNFFYPESLTNENINLKDLINKVESYLKEYIKDNNISFITEIDNCEMNINETLLINTILNICENVIEAFKQNESTDKIIFINVENFDNKVIIKIKDTAGGIDQAIINKIFEPYFTTKHMVFGRGLGLYLTFKAITRSFNGEIEVKNVNYRYLDKEFKGVEFIISIPKSK